MANPNSLLCLASRKQQDRRLACRPLRSGKGGCRCVAANNAQDGKLAAVKGVKASQVRGLGELRWISGKKQHRLLGFFGDGVWYAVLGCTHKQSIYSPTDALATAVKRKNEIQKVEVKTVEYDL